ncbi:MAG TPA: c-type cytochrome domain-containing protein [Terriglobia bacterium]|nr:c-type cytochrome domain-containing protein [Terriglobia bacterium]
MVRKKVPLESPTDIRRAGRIKRVQPTLTAVAVTIARALALIGCSYFALAAAGGIATPVGAADTTAPTYTAQIAPIFQQSCLACHSATTKMGGLVLDNYEGLMKGGIHSDVIIPGKAEESRMIQMLEGKVQPRMPFGGDPLPPAAIATIKAWIDEGAKGPAPGEPGGVTTPLAPLAIPDLKPQVPAASPVGSLRFSPDGKLLAVGGYKQVRLLDPGTGKALATLDGHADLVRSLAFSPDGKYLAAAGGLPQRSGEIKIWDVATRQLVKTIEGHADCIYSVAWSPNGPNEKMLATGSYDKMVKLWDVETGKELRNLKDHIDAVFSVAFSPDGQRLASGAQDRTVKVWDVASGQRLFTLSDAQDGITSVCFRPDGKEIAAAGYDKTIYVWNLTDTGGSLVKSLIADEDSILALAYSPDRKIMVTSSADNSIRFRDADTLDPLRALEDQPDWVEALSVSPDGKWLAAGRYNGTLSLYDMKTFQQMLGPVMAFEPYQPAGPARQTASVRMDIAPK